MDQVETKETGSCVRNGIANLPKTYRRILIMHYIDGLPIKEIAVSEGINTGAAKVRLHRARKRFHDSCLASCDISGDGSGEVVCGPKHRSSEDTCGDRDQ